MIIKNLKDFYHKIVEYYFLRPDYTIYNDPTLTYQELCLIKNAQIKHTGLDELDTEDMIDCLYEWEHYCYAHFYKSPVIDKPWDQVLQDKRNSPPNMFETENGTYYIWYSASPYRDIAMVNEQENLRSDEIHREKNRIYQRERRAKLKSSKETKNGR